MKKFFIAFVLVSCLGLNAENVGWRVDGSGKYPNASGITEWSKDKGVLWKTPTKAWSNATPIVVDNKIFICEEPSTLVCLSAVDGKELWRKTNSFKELFTDAQKAEAEKEEKTVAELKQKKGPFNKKYRELRQQSKKDPQNKTLKEEMKKQRDEMRKIDGEIRKHSKLLKPSTHGVNGYSSPTPISDGKNIYVLFGTGILAGYDLDGNRKWIKQLNRPSNGWGTCASPALSGGKLIVQIGDRVTGVNPADGKQLWQARSKNAWGSLVACKLGNDDAIITGSGDLINSNDGKFIAKSMVPIPWQTPIVENGIMYVADQKGAYAVKLPASLTGKPETLWQQKYNKPRADRYYASPLLYEGLLYAITQNGHLSVLDAKTGDLVYEQKTNLGRTIYPSPVLIGGNIFLSSDRGKTIVLKPGKTYNVVTENNLEAFRSCPVVYNGKLFIRGLKNLYCIGK